MIARNTVNRCDFRVCEAAMRDPAKFAALTEEGRAEIELASREMVGLEELRRRFCVTMPLKGARICGCVHVSPHTAVLIRTLISLGAQVRWCSCNPLSSVDCVAVALAAEGVP